MRNLLTNFTKVQSLLDTFTSFQFNDVLFTLTSQTKNVYTFSHDSYHKNQTIKFEINDTHMMITYTSRERLNEYEVRNKFITQLLSYHMYDIDLNYITTKLNKLC